MNKSLYKMGKWVNDHSTKVLATGSLVGLVATMATTAYAAINIYKELNDGKARTKGQVAVVVAKNAAIPVATAVATGGCIVKNEQEHTRTVRKLMRDIDIIETASMTYKNKVIEKFGAKKEKAEIQDSIVVDEVREKYGLPLNGDPSLIADCGGTVLYLESYTGQLFRSNIQTLKEKEKEFREVVDNSNDDWECINTWLELLGLRTTDSGYRDGFHRKFNNRGGFDIDFTYDTEVNITTGETATVLYYKQPLLDYEEAMRRLSSY